MDIEFREVLALIAQARDVEPGFWKSDPLYIRFAPFKAGQVAETLSYASADTTLPDIHVDVDADENVIGIEVW